MKALVLIDVQEGFRSPFWGQRNNPGAESSIERVLMRWRSERQPVVHVRHLSRERGSPLRPELEGAQWMEFARPLSGELVVEKSVNSAFIGTRLDEKLAALGIGELVFVGFTTDHCVSTSVRMASNLGFRCQVLSDATVAFDRVGPGGERYAAELVHRISLASLRGEFAEVVESRGF